MQESNEAADIRHDYMNQVREIESTIHVIGVPFDRIRECIEAINEVAQDHPVVTRLVAGDVFRRLVPCARSALLNALGRVRGVKVYLEPTVVIPLLCYKLYKEAAGNRLLRSARWLFQRASALHLSFVVPDVYVEECAVHLVNAGRFINVMYKVDPKELSYSENAFVAFYAALADEEERPPQFKEFLELFGFEAAGGFDARVDHVSAKIRSILRSYDIAVVDVHNYRADPRIRRVAEQDLEQLYHQNNIDKPHILVRHDVQVLTYIRDNAKEGGTAMMLATWDNTLQVACRMDEYDWWCMDPLHAGDLMALVEPGGGRGALGIDVALLLDDAHLQMASKLWDTIARIEKDNMFDAQLIAKAVKFRKEFLARQTSDSIAVKQIASSWQTAKQ